MNKYENFAVFDQFSNGQIIDIKTGDILIEDIFEYYSHESNMIFKFGIDGTRVEFKNGINLYETLKLAMNNKMFKFTFRIKARDALTNDDYYMHVTFNKAFLKSN
jgi:hypothetical protein